MSPSLSPSPSRLIAGCMTGTSLDAIDVALVDIQGHGLSMRCRFIGMVSDDLGTLRPTLAAMARGEPHTALAFARAARALGQCHAGAVGRLCREHLPADARLHLVVAHGQTLWHAPDESLSWQLMDPWPLVRQLGVPVLYDLRQADLVAQGQGAPITPLADWVLYRDPAQLRLIVNLGGICNITALPASCQPADITGGDIGPCNLLIDGLVQKLYPGQHFDQDGRIARTGAVHPELGAWVRQSPFFARPAPHSTGREDFNAAWLNGLLARMMTWPKEDIIASAVEAAAVLIADYAKTLPGHGHVILAGGSVHNPVLVQRLGHYLGADLPLTLSDALGIPAAAREAVAFAILGALSEDQVPITLPLITGSDDPGLAGAWAYP